MKLVIQRVQRASVTIDDVKTAEIGKGLMILLGVGREDVAATMEAEAAAAQAQEKAAADNKETGSELFGNTAEDSRKKPEIPAVGIADEDIKKAEKYAEKLLKLRIFEDENGKTNLNLAQVGGELLIVSQFTLYADTSSNRPGFTPAAPPALAEALYEHFVAYCAEKVPVVRHGEFGADMKVELINDGPFTILLDKV